ncbi:MAG: hypothetical protein OEM19_02660 [Deltaproteobacteria bacterium]|nr:hypothetical protein [Deltaproteobacteria bacterium]
MDNQADEDPGNPDFAALMEGDQPSQRNSVSVREKFWLGKVCKKSTFPCYFGVVTFDKTVILLFLGYSSFGGGGE